MFAMGAKEDRLILSFPQFEAFKYCPIDEEFHCFICEYTLVIQID